MSADPLPSVTGAPSLVYLWFGFCSSPTWALKVFPLIVYNARHESEFNKKDRFEAVRMLKLEGILPSYAGGGTAMHMLSAKTTSILPSVNIDKI